MIVRARAGCCLHLHRDLRESRSSQTPLAIWHVACILSGRPPIQAVLGYEASPLSLPSFIALAGCSLWLHHGLRHPCSLSIVDRGHASSGSHFSLRLSFYSRQSWAATHSRQFFMLCIPITYRSDIRRVIQIYISLVELSSKASASFFLSKGPIATDETILECNRMSSTRTGLFLSQFVVYGRHSTAIAPNVQDRSHFRCIPLPVGEADKATKFL
eukprot:768528-Hanusia_phi.AAC.3